MSSYLWKYYLEDDLDQFRHVLETASYNIRPTAQKGNAVGQGSLAGTAISSPILSTSPRSSYKGRKASGKGPAINPPSTALTLTRADVNWRDANGLTILHRASSSTSENAIAYALALVDHPLTDLYIQDLENGWTALHRAFYFGNVTIARAIIDRDLDDAVGRGLSGVVQHAGGLIKVKDREGNAPFDLLAATIKDRTLHHGTEETEEAGSSEDNDEEMAHGISGDRDEDEGRKAVVKPLVDLHGDELFTFGSNKNLTLGFGDEDDRKYPEQISLKRPDHLLRRFYRDHLESRVAKWGTLDESFRDKLLEVGPSKPISSLPWLIRSKPVIVQDVYMSKLHTAVLTTDPESNLYICGHGPGGRLGTGSERTQFNFTCIEGGALEYKKVVTVALGLNHSLAVSEEGEVFSWGNNAFGQLGYALPSSNLKDEEPLQLLPRQIFGSVKREVIVGVAASRIHSVAFTASALYTFGKNEGQLGIVDSDARSLEAQVIPRRVAASLFSSPIKMVSAIDRATICLLEDHEVWVFANYGYSRVVFPLDGFTNYFLKNSFLTTKYDRTPNRICKISSGGDTLCALSTTGEVFAVSIARPAEQGSVVTASTTNPNKIRNALSTPFRVWSLKKSHMAARDIGVDSDGSIILTTEAGSVWRRTKRVKIKDASAAGTGEYKPKDYKFSRVPGLTRVIAVRASAFGAYSAVRKECDVTRTQVIVNEPTIWTDTYPLLSFRALSSIENDAESENPELRFWRRPTALDVLRKRVLESKDLEKDLSEVLRLEQLDSDNTYDTFASTTTSKVKIPVHFFLLAGRSHVLRQGLADLQRTSSFSASETLSIKLGEDSKIHVVFLGLDMLTLVNLILYVYTDSVVDVWHHTKHLPALAFRYRQVRTELMKIASRLELQRLEPAVRQMVNPKRCLDMDIEIAIKDAGFFQSGDIEVQLADANIRAHRAIMCQRCPFFAGLFKGRAGGRWLDERRDLMDESELVNVDLKHVPLDIFQLVLRHIYADTGEELFDDIITNNQDEFLDKMMEVLSVANELMLERLSQICQNVLGRFVNARSACQLLNAVAPSAVTELKDAVLEYLCLNLEAMLENHLLDELDEDLLLELDHVVHENQLACLPFVRSGRAEALLHEKYPELAELIDRSRQSKIDVISVQTKVRQDSGLFSSSFGGSGFEELSSSPMEPKGRRRSSKKAKGIPSSPEIRLKPAATEMVFDLDDVDVPNDLTFEDAALSGSQRTWQHEEPFAAGSSFSHGKTELHLKTPNLSTADQRSMATPTQGDGLLGSPSIPVSTADKREPSAGMTQPWGLVPLTSRKLDMKEIMAQASSSRTSTLSLGLTTQQAREERSSRSFGAKLSQRERKNIRPDQQPATSTTPAKPVALSPSPAVSNATSSPWQIVPRGQRIALNEVPGAESAVAQRPRPVAPTVPDGDSKATKSSATPQLTMRQTIANPSSAARQNTPAITSAKTSAEERTMPATPRTQAPRDLAPARVTPSNRPSPSLQQHRTPSSAKMTQLPSTSPSASVSSKGFAISDPTSPPPIPQSIRHIPLPGQAGASAEPNLQLSMADILSQEQARKDAVKEAAAKRSLMDIQAEQEFQAWWDMESARVQREESQSVRRASATKGKGRGRGKGASGGGRGRGSGSDTAGSDRSGSNRAAGDDATAAVGTRRRSDDSRPRRGGLRGGGRGGGRGAEDPPEILTAK